MFFNRLNWLEPFTISLCTQHRGIFRLCWCGATERQQNMHVLNSFRSKPRPGFFLRSFSFLSSLLDASNGIIYRILSKKSIFCCSRCSIFLPSAVKNSCRRSKMFIARLNCLQKRQIFMSSLVHETALPSGMKARVISSTDLHSNR